MRLRWAAVTGLAFQALVMSTSALAQSGTSDSSRKTLFTWRDGALAGGFVVLTVAMFPVDRSLAARLQDSSTQASHFIKNASRSVQYVADPGSLLIGAGMYAVGRVTHWHELTDLGLHGTEAVIVSGAVTGLLKDIAGRARPYVSGDTNPHDFRFGRGFNDGAYKSFPSGHATAAFAAASVVTSESRRWWPHAEWLVAPAMYGGATLVGLSRMYNNAHWASDVALGAAIGTFSGIKVVRYNHAHPDNWVDRTLGRFTVSTTGKRDASVGWSTEW
jgi:membrane-associated phospholipid phosphatase